MTKNPTESTAAIQSMLVTPEMAKDWLEKNTSNRPVDQRRVKALAAVMSRGEFLPTHQGIAFSTSGALLDGQHRLLAIVESGASVRMSVTWGVDPRALEVIDTGRARSAGQTLAIQNTPHAHTVAALARSALIGLSAVLGSKYTDVLAFVRNNQESTQFYVPVARKLSARVAGAFLRAELSGMRGMRQAAHRLVTLEFEGDGDPMRALANRLRDRLTGGARYAVTVTALRAVDEGRALKIVKEATQDLPEVSA